MTRRKPPHMSFPGWVEQQIRAAEAEGAFHDLPGAGKPIPDIDGPQHDLAWVANYLRRESVDVTDVLPPALALAKEVELLPVRLLTERSEVKARALIDELNERISRAHARPQIGPPLRVKLVNVEAAIQGWREARAAAAPARTPAPTPPVRTRSRWRRRSGRS